MLFNPKYPYRNTNLDAAQVLEFFYNTSNNVSAYNYQNNYYGKKWYSIVKPNTITSFTSNVLHVLRESNNNGPHYMEATTNLEQLDSTNQYFGFSLYVQNADQAPKFRLDVGRLWADFDLSSGTIISSNGVLYSKITLVDTSNSIYLCQIGGKVNTYLVQYFILNPLSDITPVDSEPIFLQRTFRQLYDNPVISEAINNDLILDLLGASGNEDWQTLSGSFDLTTP
jgi:hypothetical protein